MYSVFHSFITILFHFLLLNFVLLHMTETSESVYVMLYTFLYMTVGSEKVAVST
jgi:hypothetical protein